MKKHAKTNFGCMVLAALVFACSHLSFAQEFVHPGMLNNEIDFARIREQVNLGNEPWKGGWDALEYNWHSWPTYGVRGPVDTIYRGGSFPQNYMLLAHDASAAYANALRWKISGNEDNARKSLEILNAYARRLKEIGGSTDAMLAMGFQGYQLANAAEIMRTYEGWSAEELHAFQNFMLEVFYGLTSNPHYNGIRRFLAVHNGTQDGYYWANWDLAAMTTMLSIGILCDNRDIYNEAINYFKSGSGNGNIAKLVNYIHDGTLGQWQESGRDQGHTSMGPPLMAIFCEMAWKQGEDLYGYDDNRLLKGSEYVAKYNFGNAVPFTTYQHPRNFGGYEEQTAVSSAGRGSIRTGWDLLYNHYVVRKGLPAPYTQISAYVKRPEGGPSNGNSGDFDLIGYSTLTASLYTGFQKVNQDIAWADTTMTLGDPDLDLGAVASSGLPCYYTLSDFSMGEIVNNKFRAYKAGALTVTAWQTGDELTYEAQPVSRQIIINEPTPTNEPVSLDGQVIRLQVMSSSMCIDVADLSLAEGGLINQWHCHAENNQKWHLTQISGDEYKLVSVNSGLAMDVVNNSDSAGALIEQRNYTSEDYQTWKLMKNTDNTIRIINKGNNLALGVLDSSNAGGASFTVSPYTESAAQSFIYTIMKLNQTIAFDSIPNLYPRDPDYILSATSSAGLPITYTSSNPAVATVENGVLHVLKGGATAIIASQDGNDEYAPAFDAVRWLVTKRQQTLTVQDLMNFKEGGANVVLGARVSSGLPLSVYSTDTAVAKYIAMDDSLILGAMGTSVLTFTQQGNESYLPFFSEHLLRIGEANPGDPTRLNNSGSLKGIAFIRFAKGRYIAFNGFEQAHTVQVKVFDLFGKEYGIQKKVLDTEIQLDLQSLPLGQYYIQLRYNGESSAFQIDLH